MKRFAAYAMLSLAALIALSAMAYSADFEIRLKTDAGLSKFVIQDKNSSEVMKIDSAGRFRLKPSTEPDSPAVGEIFIDSGAANVLKWWNGTAWNVVGTFEVDNVTVGFSGSSLEVKDSGISGNKLDVISPPNNGQVLAWNQAQGRLEWIDALGTGTIKGVTAGSGLAGGGTGGTVTLEVRYDSSTISLDALGSLEVKDLGITSAKLGTGAVTYGKISPESIGTRELWAVSYPTSDGQFLAWDQASGKFRWQTGMGTESATSLAVSGKTELSGPVTLGSTVVETPSIAIANVTPAGITSGMLSSKLIRVKGDGGNVTIDTIASGEADGQVIILRGMDDNATVKIIPGGNVILSSNIEFALGNRDSLTLYYDASDILWFETTRNDN